MTDTELPASIYPTILPSSGLSNGSVCPSDAMVCRGGRMIPSSEVARIC